MRQRHQPEVPQEVLRGGDLVKYDEHDGLQCQAHFQLIVVFQGEEEEKEGLGEERDELEKARELEILGILLEVEEVEVRREVVPSVRSDEMVEIRLVRKLKPIDTIKHTKQNCLEENEASNELDSVHVDESFWSSSTVSKIQEHWQGVDDGI